MAFSLNKIMLIGNVGQDPETRYSANNTAVTKYSLATQHSYKNQEGEWVNQTTWHNIVSFNLADFFLNSIKKGAKLYVEGRLSKNDYTDKDGNKKYFTEVVAEKIIPLDSRGGDNSYSSQDSGGSFNQNPPADAPDGGDDKDLPF